MGYSYDYGYGYGYSGAEQAMIEDLLSGFGLAIVGFLLVFLLLALALSIVTYVFKSIGIYTIAKRRGIRNPWLAWIPVGVYWIEGSISDQYQYVVKGKIKNKRTIMLVLSIVSIISAAVQVAGNLFQASLYMGSAPGSTAPGNLVSLIFTLVASGMSIVVLLFHYIAMYDLYTSCSPQNNVMFLVLSIVFRITEPFFLFFNRKKDDGMPPRRDEPKLHIPEPVPEPWDGTESL